MEIAHRKILQRCGEGCVAIETGDRGGRFDFVRRGRMGDRLRSPRSYPTAGGCNSKTIAGVGNLGFPLGHRLPPHAMERGREHMERAASSVHPPESSRYPAIRCEEVW